MKGKFMGRKIMLIFVMFFILTMMVIPVIALIVYGLTTDK